MNCFLLILFILKEKHFIVVCVSELQQYRKKVIEGEIIGKSKMDLLCIKTQNQIIAHDLDKIEQMEQL